jgi:hypothetical protein
MVVFVAAGFSLRRPGETPVPPEKVGRRIFDWSQVVIRWRGQGCIGAKKDGATMIMVDRSGKIFAAGQSAQLQYPTGNR